MITSWTKEPKKRQNARRGYDVHGAVKKDREREETNAEMVRAKGRPRPRLEN